MPCGVSAGDVAEPQVEIAPFWRAVQNPERRRMETLVRQGRAQLYPALGLSMLLGADVATHRRASIENAIVRFERARALVPQDPEVLYLSATALALWEQRTATGGIVKRNREAIERFEELRAVDPFYEAFDVAFQLGLLYTLEGDARRAAAEYERALALRIDEGSISNVLSNLAEVKMMAGDLEAAVTTYERALSEGHGEERVLALFGLAVAQDRLGERSEALARARAALREDQRPLGALRQSSVFFVPPYEAYYYEGLGLLALAIEVVGSGAALERAARTAPRALSRPLSPGLLLSMKQILSSLEDEGHKTLGAQLAAVVQRGLSRKPPGAAPSELLSEENTLDPPEVRCLLPLLRSARAFARFLDAGGKEGPWAAEARAHLAEIERWLSDGAVPRAPAFTRATTQARP